MISLDRQVYDGIIDRALDGQPYEVCGVLGGTYEAERSRASIFHPTTNVADAPEIRYTIDPEEQLDRIDQIENDGLDVVGFYHSHPAGPTNPSETDRARATWPGYSYVIVALDGHPFLGSWRWKSTTEQFEQEIVKLD